jgi:DNA-binding response OmpR family regulator
VARILVVEDHEEMGELILQLLKEEKHHADLAPSIGEARELLAEGSYDLITLDVNLPDGKGWDFCARLRKDGCAAPIVMLTTEVSPESVVQGLQSGANDYLKKPIDRRELQARLRAHLRETDAGGALEFHSLRLNLESRSAEFEGKPIDLRGRQFDLLAILMRRPEAVISRERMIEQLGKDSEIFDRTIDSHLSQLRKRLKDAGVRGVSIASVYGVGYRLVAE